MRKARRLSTAKWGAEIDIEDEALLNAIRNVSFWACEMRIGLYRLERQMRLEMLKEASKRSREASEQGRILGIHPSNICRMLQRLYE